MPSASVAARPTARAVASVVAFVVATAALVAHLPHVPEAAAKVSYDSAYGYDRTWNSALRLVRVDLGFKVPEKDEAQGYLLFEYKSKESGSKITQGSIELVRPKEPTDAVHVLVQLPEMPHYHEQVLVDALARKLREDYGDAPSKPRVSATRRPQNDAGPADAEP